MNTGTPAVTAASVMNVDAWSRGGSPVSSLHPRDLAPPSSGRHALSAKTTVSRRASVPMAFVLTRSVVVRRGT